MSRPADNLSYAEAKKIRRTFRLLAAISIVYLGIGTIGMMILEKFSFIDALYFSVVSLTTVGYGDYSPETTAGKIFVMAYLLVGIGIIAGLINNILKNIVARRVINKNGK